VEVLVTDSGATASVIERFRDAGVQVICA
jgi:hypothetical protein